MLNPKDNIYAYVGMNLPISSANTNKAGFMLNERVKLTGNTGIAVLSTANTYLDGSGTLVNLITGAGNGTVIKRITIKAQGSTTQGMVRLFLHIAPDYFWLLKEIEIPAISQDSKHQSFISLINEPYFLQSTYVLKASTEKGEIFIVTAEGMDMSYPS